MKDTPHRVWDHNLQAMRDLAEDEWELESHWAGALEVHGNKMPGHDWVIVVPKYKLDAAEAALTAAEAKWRNLKERESDGRIEQEHRAERAEAALAEMRKTKNRESEDVWALIVRVQHQIDAAGGVPADIPLTARLDCLIQQREGRVDRERVLGKHGRKN